MNIDLTEVTYYTKDIKNSFETETEVISGIYSNYADNIPVIHLSIPSKIYANADNLISWTIENETEVENMILEYYDGANWNEIAKFDTNASSYIWKPTKTLENGQLRLRYEVYSEIFTTVPLSIKKHPNYILIFGDLLYRFQDINFKWKTPGNVKVEYTIDYDNYIEIFRTVDGISSILGKSDEAVKLSHNKEDANTTSFVWNIGDIGQNFIQFKITDLDNELVSYTTKKIYLKDISIEFKKLPNTIFTGADQLILNWTSVGVGEKVLEYSTDNENWIKIANTTDDFYTWTVPEINEPYVSVKVSFLKDPLMASMSDSFEIVKSSGDYLQILAPVNSTRFKIFNSIPIIYKAKILKNVNLSYSYNEVDFTIFASQSMDPKNKDGIYKNEFIPKQITGGLALRVSDAETGYPHKEVWKIPVGDLYDGVGSIIVELDGLLDGIHNINDFAGWSLYRIINTQDFTEKCLIETQSGKETYKIDNLPYGFYTLECTNTKAYQCVQNTINIYLNHPNTVCKIACNFNYVGSGKINIAYRIPPEHVPIPIRLRGYMDKERPYIDTLLTNDQDTDMRTVSFDANPGVWFLETPASFYIDMGENGNYKRLIPNVIRKDSYYLKNSATIEKPHIVSPDGIITYTLEYAQINTGGQVNDKL